MAPKPNKSDALKAEIIWKDLIKFPQDRPNSGAAT